jgi:hypothetical protein
MVAGIQESGRIFLARHSPTTGNEALTPEKTCTTREETAQARDKVMNEDQANHYITCIMRVIQITGQKIVPFIWKPKER